MTSKMNSNNEIIYVQLLNEGTVTYRPVSAKKLSESIYQLLGEDIHDPEDEEWEFLPGTIVKANYRKFELLPGKKEILLVAVSKV